MSCLVVVEVQLPVDPPMPSPHRFIVCRRAVPEEALVVDKNTVEKTFAAYIGNEQGF